MESLNIRSKTTIENLATPLLNLNFKVFLRNCLKKNEYRKNDIKAFLNKLNTKRMYLLFLHVYEILLTKLNIVCWKLTLSAQKTYEGFDG
jgi:hypothetical protein